MACPSSDAISDWSQEQKKEQDATGAYNSAEDSGDDLFNDIHETQATLPLSRQYGHGPSISYRDLKSQISSPARHVTQPTQILDTPVARRTDPSSVVQVAASSPTHSPAPPSPAPPRRSLGYAMAPPGTSFRPFAAAAPPPRPPPILSDSPVEHYSSDDDVTITRANIKPTSFTSGGRSQAMRAADAQDSSIGRMQELASKYTYDEKASNQPRPQKRTTDDMASAYANSSRPKKQPRQTGPSRAQPVAPDMSLQDIGDLEVQRKVARMKSVYPQKRIIELRDALMIKRGNEEDALEFIAGLEEAVKGMQPIDLTTSDDELAPDKSAVAAPKPTAKRHVKAPNMSIKDKWSSTQHVAQQAPAKALPVGSSPLPATPPRPRRRLVQGRRVPSSPSPPASPIAPAPPVQKPVPVKQKVICLESDEEPEFSDSGASSASNVEEEDTSELEEGLLEFINSCSAAELADLSHQSPDVAAAIIAARPFRSLGQVRAVSVDAPPVSQRGKQKTTRKLTSDKVVDICLEMWTGYQAVDELVSRCEKLGERITTEMKKWGFNIFGIAKGGELELTSLDDAQSDSSSLRDSGIGTPSSTTADEDDDADVKIIEPRRGKTQLLKKPGIMAEDIELKDYQVLGLNWLNLLWSKKLSCILADDMGLGKTCQVISFLSHLKETRVRGPHLIIVPGSTLENWLREFKTFSPSLVVEPYYGSQKERADQRAQLEDDIRKIDVIVTTYDIARPPDDNKFLRRIKPTVCVYDEGHMLKNSMSARYTQLMRIPAQFRLLLTGTPLQNNLQELASLLAFIMPDLFAERHEDLAYIFKYKAKTTDADHASLLSVQRIARARSMMTPFVLRRKKHQVLKYLPSKTRRVERCRMTPEQQEIYNKHLSEQRKILADRAAGRPNKNNANNMMKLRQAAIHPLLLRHIYDDDKIRKMSRACIKEPELSKSDPNVVFEEMQFYSDWSLHKLCEKHPKTLKRYALHNEEWMRSGKVQKLAELLKKHVKNGDRTLIFSQFTSMMDILEQVLETLDIQFFRLDGATPISERQDMIDEFYADESIPVFMLSTKSGGAGINLACANKVVIFDSSFNPQEDVQAENRAHRVGQKREVEVVRLISTGTIEEQIYKLGESKLALDERVAGEAGSEEGAKKVEKEGQAMVEKMLLEDMEQEKSMGDLKEEFKSGMKKKGFDISAA